MAGLVSGFPKTSENQHDGIFKAFHEFKIGNDLNDVIFCFGCYRPMKKCRMACPMAALLLVFTIKSEYIYKRTLQTVKSNTFELRGLSCPFSLLQSRHVKILAQQQDAALLCAFFKNIKHTMNVSRPWLGDVQIYLSAGDYCDIFHSPGKTTRTLL